MCIELDPLSCCRKGKFGHFEKHKQRFVWTRVKAILTFSFLTHMQLLITISIASLPPKIPISIPNTEPGKQVTSSYWSPSASKSESTAPCLMQRMGSAPTVTQHLAKRQRQEVWSCPDHTMAFSSVGCILSPLRSPGWNIASVFTFEPFIFPVCLYCSLRRDLGMRGRSLPGEDHLFSKGRNEIW